MIEVDCRKCKNLGNDECLIYGKNADKAVEMCAKDSKEANKADVIDKIRAEIAEYKDDKVIHAEQNEMIDIVLEILDKYR